MSLISFTPIQDGVTGVNAAATNTPLNTIYNDYNGNITDANISATAAIAGSKLAGNGVTADKLATNAITLGYAQITTSFSTASTSAVQVTGLTVTVTIPAGGRKVKITAWGRDLQNTGAAYNTISIWDGTVSSGTELARAQSYIVAANQGQFAEAIAVVTPAAGSKTYNVGFFTTAGTGSIEAATNHPAFLLVEAI